MDPLEQYPILAAVTRPLRRSPQKTIAGAVSGLLARTRSMLPTFAVQLAGRSGLQAARALTRLDRLLHNPRLDDWQLTRQLRWVRGQAQQRGPHAIAGSRGVPYQPLLLAIDWTAWRPRFPLLVAAAAVDRRAVPVAVEVVPRAEPLRSQHRVEERVLARLLGVLTERDRRAVLVFDRGFARASLLPWLRTHGSRPEPASGWIVGHPRRAQARLGCPGRAAGRPGQRGGGRDTLTAEARPRTGTRPGVRSRLGLTGVPHASTGSRGGPAGCARTAPCGCGW
jgi:hypothetical protein